MLLYTLGDHVRSVALILWLPWQWWCASPHGFYSSGLVQSGVLKGEPLYRDFHCSVPQGLGTEIEPM